MENHRWYLKEGKIVVIDDCLLNYFNNNEFKNFIDDYIVRNNFKLSVKPFCYDVDIQKKIYNINNLLYLANYLYLENFNNVMNIYNLTRLLKLKIKKCENIKDIGSLNKLQNLHIDNYIYGIHLLKSLKSSNQVNFMFYKCNKKQLYKLNKYKITHKLFKIKFDKIDSDFDLFRSGWYSYI